LTSRALPIIIVEVIFMGVSPVRGGSFVIKKCLISLLLLLLVGCASKDKDIKTVQGDPELLYKEGLVFYNKRLYEDALKKFEDIKSSFPDNPPYSVLAELKVADCHFQRESYPEAIAAYEEFRKTHPTHEEIPYVLYQIGMSYYNQMLTPDRDQTSTRKALTSFEYLIANYSENFFTERAKERTTICRKQLAAHEFYVGEYYYRIKKYEGAAGRFEGLLEQFPKIDNEDRTLFFLGKSYIELGKGEEAKEVLTRLVTDYPKSLYAREAKTILDRGIPAKARSAARGTAPAMSGKPGVEVSLERDQLALIRFEEEGRKQVPQNGASSSGSLPNKGLGGVAFSDSKPTTFMVSQGSADKQKQPAFEPIPQKTGSDQKPKSEEINVATVPSGEGRQAIPPSTGPDLEVKPEGEMRKGVAPVSPASPPIEKEKPEKSEGPEKSAKSEKSSKLAPPEERFKVGDTDQPIDITSDRVETYTKEGLITFKGNVTARQRDMVIYADSLEAMISQDGKTIEKVTAGGNVKIQQGLRVANCEKAIFYNLEKKVVLTGEPRVWEGDNMVSGEEIVVDVERDRVEVKGGSAGRGKAKISP
jgi:outer membrane protein assembly factor BamD